MFGSRAWVRYIVTSLHSYIVEAAVELRIETANTKLQTPGKLQAPTAGRGLELGTWDFFGVWCLELGVCTSRVLIGLWRVYSQDSQIMPHSHRAEADVEVGERD